MSDMPTGEIDSVFEQLTLKREHAKVYYACLELGPSAVSVIAKKAKVPRSSCYALLDELMLKGLVSCVESEAKRVFAAESPALIQELLQRKESDLQMSLTHFAAVSPTLAALHKSQHPDLPRVRFFQGVEGLRALYYDTLSFFEHLCICQGSTESQTSPEADPVYLKEYIDELLKRMISTRELIEDTPVGRRWKERYSSDRNQIILMPKNTTADSGHVGKLIYGNKIAYVSHDSLIGVVVEDETLAKHEKSLFEMLWKVYKK